MATPLAFGLALLVAVASIGHVSGGHVNPAVRIGLAAAGAFALRLVPAYVIGQVVGAILGALATWLTFGKPGRDEAALAATAPAPGVGGGTTFVVELLVTFVLVFVVVSVATDERVHPSLAPVAVGAALAVAVLIAGPVTGGSVNPARTLGPAVVAGDFSALWAYLLGPIVGGALAALLYHRFLAKGDKPA
ncbi:aquaporin [Pseudonocardia halophobica]|uniref:aquaporin n=1 Tax=Pseudonocardia halophobica TaxID=29401 RepID=UPI003D8D3800